MLCTTEAVAPAVFALLPGQTLPSGVTYGWARFVSLIQLCAYAPVEFVFVCPSSIAEWTGVVKWLVPVLTVVHVSAPLGGLLSESGGEVG